MNRCVTGICFAMLLAISVKAQTNTLVPDTSKVLHIALMLPFYTEKYNPDSQVVINTTFPKEVRMAAEYYWGMKLALDSLKKDGLHINVHVYDTQDDSTIVKKDLVTASKESDVIITASNLTAGKNMYPILNLEDTFAVKRQIPLMAAVNSAYVPIHDNPYYFIMNATLRTHINALLAYTTKRYHAKNITIINPQEKDSEYVRVFKQVCDEKGVSYTTYDFGEDSLSIRVLTNMTTGDTNIIVFPSTAEDIVQGTLNELQKITDYKYVVLGLPHWRNFSTQQIPLLNASNVYITGITLNQKSLKAFKLLESRYKRKVNRPLTDNVLMGFEQTLWLSDMYFNHTEKLNDLFTTTTYNGLCNKYNLMKVYDAAGNCQYNENKNVFILKARYNGFTKVN